MVSIFAPLSHSTVDRRFGGLCSGIWHAIKAVPCRRLTPASERFVTSPFYCLHELDRKMQQSAADIKPRGEDLLVYCGSADLNFCNVGNKPTFRTKTRDEVLDLTLVNRCA